MPNLVEVAYGQTGQSTKTSNMGMREMQERAYWIYLTSLLQVDMTPIPQIKSRQKTSISLS